MKNYDNVEIQAIHIVPKNHDEREHPFLGARQSTNFSTIWTCYANSREYRAELDGNMLTIINKEHGYSTSYLIVADFTHWHYMNCKDNFSRYNDTLAETARLHVTRFVKYINGIHW